MNSREAACSLSFAAEIAALRLSQSLLTPQDQKNLKAKLATLARPAFADMTD
jgi:hypothetical protein